MGEQKKYWEGKHFAFYTNKECEYYPCHPVPEGTEFNCLLLPALYAGAEVRGKLHLFGKRRQGL